MVIREPAESDQGYVTSTWLRSLRTRAPYRDMVPREYFATMGTTIDRLLDRADTRALVADTADRIVGWLVWTPIPGAPVLHYVYVRASERRHGVARALADRAGLDTSSPVVYLFGGPDRRWLLQKAPRSVSMSADNFLSG